VPDASPPARGVRLDWSQLPRRILAAVEHELGGRVVQALTQPEGFSPAIAARLRTDTGSRAFLKAVPPGPNPDAPWIYRRELSDTMLYRVAARVWAALDDGPDGICLDADGAVWAASMKR